jgi:hypothetical protein
LGGSLAGKTMETAHPAPGKCPHCGHRFDLASGVTDLTAKPSPGDFSLCIQCGRILRFDAQLSPQALTLDDATEIAARPHLAETVRRIQWAHGVVTSNRQRRN